MNRTKFWLITMGGVLLLAGAIIGGTWAYDNYIYKQPVEAVEGLKRIEADKYGFYYPEAFAAYDDNGGNTDYFYAEQEITNELRDYLSLVVRKSADAINSDRCQEIADRLGERGYSISTVALPVQKEQQQKYCQIRSSLAQGALTIMLEQRIYQKDGQKEQYILTAVYDQDSPHATMLKKALDTFLLR